MEYPPQPVARCEAFFTACPDWGSSVCSGSGSLGCALLAERAPCGQIRATLRRPSIAFARVSGQPPQLARETGWNPVWSPNPTVPQVPDSRVPGHSGHCSTTRALYEGSLDG
jgi:hypothetical protein